MNDSRFVEVDASDPHMELDQRLVAGESIGEGAMCRVIEVFDNNLLRTSAMKVLHDDLSADLNTRRRMIEEAQITAQLDHPNIVPVYELGRQTDGTLYFTMKAVRGRTLGELLEARPPDTRTEEALLMLLQCLVKVCDALAYAHTLGVIHRDLKPDNIMVGDFGEVYLMDWGIAKLRSRPDPAVHDVASSPRRGRKRTGIVSQDGKYVGTPHYMSPEQARGDHAGTDARSDIFALGAILYEVLVGRPPYDEASLLEVLMAAARGQITPPDQVTRRPLPQRLCRIAMQAMSVDPARRHPSARDFKMDLERFMQSGWHFPLAEFAPGTAIVEEGQMGDRAFIIVKGRCLVEKIMAEKVVTLAELGPGDVFGETAVLAKEPRGATVRAIEPVVARVVPREYFEEDLGSGQSLGLFVRALARRFNERNRRALDLEQELEFAQIEEQTLRYLIFAGQTNPEGRREAPWSRLAETLSARFKRSPDWLLARLLDNPMIEVDIGADRISLGRL